MFPRPTFITLRCVEIEIYAPLFLFTRVTYVSHVVRMSVAFAFLLLSFVFHLRSKYARLRSSQLVLTRC